MRKTIMQSHNFSNDILRAYDIRGVVGKNLNYKDAEILGNVFSSSFKKNNKVVVCRDGRLSSPEISKYLVKGLKDSGSHVIDIGIGPSPMLYFAANTLNTDGAIMVTGSHNPPNYNGFKIMKGVSPFFGQDIKDIGVKAFKGDWKLLAGGKIEEKNIENEYIDSMINSSKFENIKTNLKAVWDSGNGSAGIIMEKLVKKLPGKHILINKDINGNFPSHHPDPTDPDNLVDLIKIVRNKNFDLGIAFDGDGDRIGIVSSKGNIVWGDQLIAFLAREVLKSIPGAPIIADVKASKCIFDEIKNLGGNPYMWKTGHSFIKAKMKEISAPLAGEMSGHIFFADRYYGYDDALYASLRVLELIDNNFTLDLFLDSLPKTYSTPEIKIYCSDKKKFSIVKELGKTINNSNDDIIKIDGLRVNCSNGWWLLRASNTQEAIIARMEATSKEDLELMKIEIDNLLKIYDLSLNI